MLCIYLIINAKSSPNPCQLAATPQEFSTIYNRTSLPGTEQKALFPEKWPGFGTELKTGELHEWDYFVQRDGKDVGFVGIVIKDGKLIGVYSNWPEAIIGGQTLK